jgi:Ca-activated chloride channel family protein
MRRGRCLLLFAALLLLGGWELFQAPHPQVERGNDAFKEGRYDDAIEAYRRALEALPGHPAVRFDLGAALHQKALSGPPAERERLLDDAQRELQAATQATDPGLRSQAHYNLGNTLFQKEKYAEAANEYKRAIKHDLQNLDARYNLELALRKQSQKPKPPDQQPQGQGQPQQQPSGQGPDQKPQDPPQPKEQGQAPQKPQDQPPPPEGSDRPQEPQDQKPEQGGKPDEPRPSGDPPREEPPEPRSGRDPFQMREGESDADRKLDALERRSKSLQVDRQRRSAGQRQRGRTLKDW